MAKIAIIGAGHNSLVTACYLAKAQHEVAIYEASDRVGGLCVNEEIWPGYTVSIWANWSGMLHPQVINDLGLKLPPVLDSAAEIAVTTNGDYISHDEVKIKGLSEEDHAAIERWDTQFASVTGVLNRYFLAEKPRRDDFLRDLEGLDLVLPPEQFMEASLLELTAHFTTSPGLRGMLACNSFLHPCHPNSGYSRAYMGIPYSYENGRWGFIQGGMGVITQELERIALESGVTINTACPVKQIITDKTQATGFALLNGETVNADVYVCGTDYPTFQRLSGQTDIASMRSHGYGVANFHLKLKHLPEFNVVNLTGIDYPPSISLLPSFEDIQASHDAYVKGENYHKHIISIAVPSIIDPDRAPPGQHVMCVHVDQSPVAFSKDGWTAEDRQAFFKQICAEIAAYAPGFEDCIDEWRLYTPQDLKEQYQAEGQHCFHGDLGWDRAMDARMPGIGAGPETGFDNLYVCGSACHPGGTVTGAPGYRCAQSVIKKLMV